MKDIRELVYFILAGLVFCASMYMLISLIRGLTNSVEEQGDRFLCSYGSGCVVIGKVLDSGYNQ